MSYQMDSMVQRCDSIPRLSIQYESYYFLNHYDPVFSVDSIILCLFRQMHKRALTANPTNKHKHQQAILKEIKTAMQLEKMDQELALKRALNQGNDHPPKKINYRKDNGENRASPFERKLKELQRLSSKKGKKEFSLEKDQGRICQAGWQQFSEKMERATHSSIQQIRRKVNQIRNKPSVSSIFTNHYQPRECQQSQGGVDISDQPLKKLWSMVKGSEKMGQNERYFRVTDLRKDISQSCFLKNAYQFCLHSKKYKESAENSFVDQKFKSFVYLQQNQNKLSKKRTDELLKNNYLIA